jgi:Tfp pilus assembly protein PilF
MRATANDWYRNKDWNEAIAADFRTRLKRARSKQQYLRIQASYLAHTNPNTALALLDEYFALGEDFDFAQAYLGRATAFVALERVAEAVDAYEHALLREIEFPKLLTDAYLELPMFVTMQPLPTYYERAMEVLRSHAHRPMFPRDHFQWHGTLAILESRTGQIASAKQHAARALEAASLTKSGLPYHPRIGLVDERLGTFLEMVRKI